MVTRNFNFSHGDILFVHEIIFWLLTAKASNNSVYEYMILNIIRMTSIKLASTNVKLAIMLITKKPQTTSFEDRLPAHRIMCLT